MKKEISDKVNNIFDKYDKKQQEIKKEQVRIKTDQDLFLEKFDKLISDVIRPTMEQLSSFIMSRGHSCKITQSAESRDSQGKKIAASIKMEIYPGTQQPYHSANRYDLPSLSFIAIPLNNKIFTHVSTMMPGRGGSRGARNEYILESITSETVENEVVFLLNECFGK